MDKRYYFIAEEVRRRCIQCCDTCGNWAKEASIKLLLTEPLARILCNEASIPLTESK